MPLVNSSDTKFDGVMTEISNLHSNLKSHYTLAVRSSSTAGLCSSENVTRSGGKAIVDKQNGESEEGST